MTRILIVDDKEMMRDSVATTLVRKGYVVVTASSGADALEKLSKRTFEGREATSLVRSGLNQNEAAAELGISKQAMSQRLQAAGWQAESAGWRLAVNLLARAEAGRYD